MASDECLLAADEAIDQVARWLAQADEQQTAQERRTASRLQGVVSGADNVAFALSFVDRVIRPEDDRVAAGQLARVIAERPLPDFLSALDTLALRLGALLAPRLPGVVVPLARRRLRQLVGHLVVDAEPSRLRRHLERRRDEGFELNVNLLGEAVLGRAEADRRFAEALRLLDEPDIDYVSVKLSSLVGRLNHWDHEGSLREVGDRVRVLFDRAARTDPPTFVNLDMEEYHDLELTLSTFMSVLDEPELRSLQAGIVLQAYLPDSFEALRTLVDWADRRASHGSAGDIKIRLVKGANLAMERVEAALHGWEQAPYSSKAETDANYKRCLDWALTPERLRAVRIGLASHNLFDVAWGLELARRRGVGHRVGIEMLEGMAPTHARVLSTQGHRPLVYTPVVAPEHFDVAISYLFRRLEENSSDENFIRHLFALQPGSDAFEQEAARFRLAVVERHRVASDPRRRPAGRPSPSQGAFENEPDSDPALSPVRAQARALVDRPPPGGLPRLIDEVATVDEIVARAALAQPAWAAAADRGRRLHQVGDELARRRSDLVAAMVHEGRKTVAQADPEVSEAIDFARYYADRSEDLDGLDGAEFTPLGVVLIAPPWNFPVAIPAGGVLAALAAGNSVILKPAPEVPGCARLVAECCWAAGVPREVLQLARTPDDEIGRHLVSHGQVAGIVMTGAHETAQLFGAWNPGARLLAETSGKNAMVITPSADVDLAVADLVASAFGHSGQKCSAASLAICVGQLHESPRFRRQLIDAVESMAVGLPWELATETGPLISAPGDKLHRGLTRLDEGESWLVEPRRIDDDLWRPGIRVGVRPGSWFHQTECFGPVLGLIRADSLEAAVDVQNATPFGLTGGLHSLDQAEIDWWTERVEVGNAYVNRSITGAIVRRQPFGGWKRSSVGPGAKAGGPNYVAQLGHWIPTDERRDASWLESARRSDQAAWDAEFGREHDPTGLFCEANLFRYRPLGRMMIRSGAGTDEIELERVRSAAARCGVSVVESRHEPVSAAIARLGGVERIRALGRPEPELAEAAAHRGIHLAAEPVTRQGRIELLHYLREQSVSITRHRYGNLVA